MDTSRRAADRPLYEQHVAGPALAAFLRVSTVWKLDEAQERMLLGEPSPERLKQWKEERSGALTLDQVERISYVLRIFRVLNQLAGEDKVSKGWLWEARNEPIFGGRRPIDLMCVEDVRGLRQVSRHLQSMTDEGLEEDNFP